MYYMNRYNFYFQNVIIICQEVSISMKPPNNMAKEFFAMEESYPVQNVTQRIKQI